MDFEETQRCLSGSTWIRLYFLFHSIPNSTSRLWAPVQLNLHHSTVAYWTWCYIISSMDNISTQLFFFCKWTCMLSGHKAQSLPPLPQMSRKAWENVCSSCRVDCFSGCRLSVLSLGNSALTLNDTPWHYMCFSLLYLAIYTLSCILLRTFVVGLQCLRWWTTVT